MIRASDAMSGAASGGNADGQDSGDRRGRGVSRRTRPIRSSGSEMGNVEAPRDHKGDVDEATI